MMATYYSQPCPVCGRTLQIRVQYLGRRISCRHCHGEFDARDSTVSSQQSNVDLMLRVDELLSPIVPRKWAGVEQLSQLLPERRSRES